MNGLNKYMGLETGWPLLMLMGLGFTWMGWSIFFTNWGLEWMYKQGIWFRSDRSLSRSQKELNQFNKIRGGAMLAMGILLLIAAILVFFNFFL